MDENMSSSSEWTREEEKAFEKAIVSNPEDSIDRWEKIAEELPGRTVEEIKNHYELLVEDVNNIEAGLVTLPIYISAFEGSTEHASEGGTSKKGGIHLGHFQSESNHGSKSSRADQERRKGIAWTEDEHRLFLLGLDKYGKGDWRSISRNFVVSRTPTQVASHAQKYFIRLNSMNKDRRRSSIHDITSVGSGDVSSPQGPITGQTNGATPGGGSSSKSTKPQPQPSSGAPGVGVYGTPTIGQPVGGPLIPAVGTPVNLSAPPHMAYGIRAPVPSMPPMTYPMPHRGSLNQKRVQQRLVRRNLETPKILAPKKPHTQLFIISRGISLIGV